MEALVLLNVIMNEELVWLKTSLFADQSEWHNVLDDGIKVFLADSRNKAEAKNWQLCFNYLNGDNIRFSVQTEAKVSEQFAKRIDDFFGLFFLRYKKEKKEIKPSLTRIFLPPPKNSILYGLYVAPISAGHNIEISSKLSHYIMSSLRDDTIDEESLMTLAFYFQAALIIEFRKNHSCHFLNTTSYQYNSASIMEDSLRQSFLTERHVKSQTVLQEIIQSINDHSEFDNTLYWLKAWINDCGAFAARASKENEKKTFVDIRNLINQQLGLTPNMIKLLYYFINQELFI